MKNYQYKTPYLIENKQVILECKSLDRDISVYGRLYLAINVDDNEPYKYWVNMSSPFKTQKGADSFLDKYLGNTKPSKYWS